MTATEKNMADEIKKYKEGLRIKHTTKTSFKKGQVVPGCGRKKGSKNVSQKKTLYFLTNKLVEVIAALIISLESETFQNLTVEVKSQIIPDLIKGLLLAFKKIEKKETLIKSNGSPTSSEFDESKI